MDVDSISLGRDFRQALQERLATCDVMLALIGRDWLDGKDTSGQRRLDNPGDFVRMEIAAALKRNIPVTPLLLHGAHMPTVEQLPEDLSQLAYRNGFELSHNRWESDVQELVKRLGLVTRNDTPAGTKTDSVAPTRPPARKSWVAITGAGIRKVIDTTARAARSVIDLIRPKRIGESMPCPPAEYPAAEPARAEPVLLAVGAPRGASPGSSFNARFAA